MHKLLQYCYECLYSTNKGYHKNRKFLLPISLIHSFSKALDTNAKLDFLVNEVKVLSSSKPTNQIAQMQSKTYAQADQSEPSEGNDSTVQISHPWPEWVDLMELLLKRGYFKADENPFRNDEGGPKEMNWIRTACLNFARDHFGLVRFFSRKDIQVISGCGCPSLDRKVVNSGKRLRAHVGIHEGNVCSLCNLRGECDRAFVKAREHEGGRTVDVMRILLTYGLDSASGTLENKPCQNKMVKESVKRLLKEMVEYSSQELDAGLPTGTALKRPGSVQDNSITQEKVHINVPMKQGDWLCPKCDFLNFARNIKCLRCDGFFEERLKQLREDQDHDHLPLKKGDWICEKCHFLNFAKNTRCLQCKEKPPKRQLNPGEWECESCNYINFRRNMECLKCDHRRPKASMASKTPAQLERDNGGNLNHKRSRFLSGENEVGDRKSLGLERTNRKIGAGTWRFVAEEREDSRTNSWNENSRFVDFPIAGGKSSLSHDAQRKERWKLEMLERSKTAATTKENDKDLGYVSPRTRFKFLESTDDEDMADWFGHDNKMEAKSCGSTSEEILD